MVVVHVLTLPFTSVTVNVSVLAPTSEQLNAVWLNTMLAIPHASDEPLFTAVAVVLPLPDAFNCTVTS
jgi:ABC-type maltose transport system permease subunit